MKKLLSLSPLFFIISHLLFFPLNNLQAQKQYEWAGKWSIESIDLAFCNIHISPQLDSKGHITAIIEGKINQESFLVKCRVVDIPQRKALAFYKEEHTLNSDQFNYQDPILIALTEKHEIVNIVWNQINMTNEDLTSELVIRQVSKPQYKGDFQVFFKNKKSLIQIKNTSKRGFYASIWSQEQQSECHCKLKSSHIAICSIKDSYKPFYLIFHERSIRVREGIIKDYKNDTPILQKESTLVFDNKDESE